MNISDVTRFRNTTRAMTDAVRNNMVDLLCDQATDFGVEINWNNLTQEELDEIFDASEMLAKVVVRIIRHRWNKKEK